MSWRIVDWFSKQIHGEEPIATGAPASEKEVEEREPSLMHFDPEDHGTKCNICGAGMTSFGSMSSYSFEDERMKLTFSCAQEWEAPSRDDLYWTYYNQCKNASALLRALRNEQ